ncbi:MAG: trigger factor [Patescibacteria group bacterium]
MNVTKEVRHNAEVVLKGTLPKETVKQFYEKAVDAAVKEVSMSGFRKGHAPKDLVIKEVGVGFLWKDAAERALREEVDDLLKQEKLVPIVPLALSLKGAEPDLDVDFEIVVVTPPVCESFDYKTVAQKALAALPTEDVTKETAEAKRAFRTQVRAIAKMSKPEEVKEGDSQENEDKADVALSDDEAKLVGFENGEAAEFFIHGEAEKAVHDRGNQKKRSAVAEALIAGAVCQIPNVLVEEESRSLLETFKRDVAGQNLQWNEYLKRVGKTEEQVREDLRPSATKRITLDLVFGNIIREEKLELTEEDKKKEEEFAHKIVSQGVPHDRAHSYARESFMREKVWEVVGVKSEPAVS